MKTAKSLINMALLLLLLLLMPLAANAGNGKLLATPGVSSIEGAAGGGIVPWAQLAGYATETQISGSTFCSHANTGDYALNVCGFQINLYDRLEFSAAKQSFSVNALNLNVGQRIFGTKIRLVGDVIYGKSPQFSIGIQAKKNEETWVANAFGASDSSGTDIYLAASKVHLGAIAGFNVIWNMTLRNTDANQTGLLGFGANNQGRSTVVEASAALFLRRDWAIGIEYRQKPNSLTLKEDDWADVFVAWFPNKLVNVTAAYLDLGDIAGVADQRGWYVSIMGNY